MDAIWSYWSAPSGEDHRARWATTLHHLLSWTLSVLLGRQWFERTVLVTDSAGADLLAGSLRLPFDEVHYSLDRLPDDLARWWALGKLHTYGAQRRPFVHLDSDTYLWSPLQPNLLNAPVLVQNPERFPFALSCYDVTGFVRTVRDNGGWLPEELEWYAALEANEAFCCGILGVNQLDFIAEYADRAIAMIEANSTIWKTLPAELDFNVVVEQYFLSAFYYFHARSRRYGDFDICHVFSTESDAFDERQSGTIGYTHLMGDTKHDPAVLLRLIQRVERDYPEYFQRALAVSALINRDPVDTADVRSPRVQT